MLSPFEVNAGQDTGYLASTAQSGTRLRTDLKDIASSISVITKDFMDDIGARDLQSLLIYTLGTEVNGPGGNFADAGEVNNPNGVETDYDSAFASASPTPRIRGLTTADLSRDFFITSIPLDTYNVDRVEISRGPNAMLFGLGSPSGIINNSLIRADTNRHATTTEVRIDQYGSLRGELDHNQVLIKDKLAFRLAASYDDQSYQVEEAWRRSKRGFFTATYRPFRDTTIRVSTEKGEISSNLPEIRPPVDTYTMWWYMGKPAWNANNNTGRLLGTPAPGWPTTVFTASGAAAQTGGPTYNGTNTLNTGNLFSAQIGAIGGASRQMVLVYDDPTSSELGMGLPGRPDIVGFRAGNYDRHQRNAAGVPNVQTQTRGLRDWAYILNRVFHYNDNTYNYWKSAQLSDPAIFDFYNHMLHGPNKHEWAEFETYNITFDQQLFDGKAGVELAFNRDRLDNGNRLGLDSVISGYTLRLDMVEILGNGERNPNFGRPFTTAYSKATVRSNDRDVFRATAYYNLDLRETGPEWLGKVLGKHVLNTSYTDFENVSLFENGDFAFANGTDYALREHGAINQMGGSQRGLPIMRYLGPDLSGTATPALSSITVPTHQWPEVESAKILYYNTPPVGSPTGGTWSEETFSILSAGEKDVEEVRDNITYTREEVKSTVGIAQSYWFEGNLVSTVGWRRDEVKTFNAGQPLNDPQTGLAILDDDFYPRPVTDMSETSVNYGVVLHTPQFIARHLPLGSTISLVYNKADNFRPAGQRYNLYDEPLDAESGSTEEYGVTISSFNGKLVLKAAKYETTSLLSSTLVASLETPRNNWVGLMDTVQTEVLRGTNNHLTEGLAAWNSWWTSNLGQTLRNTFRFVESVSPTGVPDISTNRRTGEVVSPADVVSSGEEYELVYNPLPNWRIAFNANRAKAVRNNTDLLFRDLIWDSLLPLMEGPAGQLKISNTVGNNQVARDTFLQQVYNQVLPVLATEGAPNSELRQWHWNFLTNYSFTEGPLKGWSIGGGVRWQDKVVIGFPITTDFDVDPVFGVVPDVNNPYYGPSRADYDMFIGYTREFSKFTWKVQFRVDNIGVGNELIPLQAQPDGSIASWRIASPQKWTLRNTFTF